MPESKARTKKYRASSGFYSRIGHPTKRVGYRARIVRIWVLLIEQHCLRRGVHPFAQRRFGIISPMVDEKCTHCTSQPQISFGVIRVRGNSSAEQFVCVPGGLRSELVKLPRPATHEVPGCEVLGGASCYPLALSPEKLRLNRRSDLPGNLVLQSKDIRQITIIALCP